MAAVEFLAMNHTARLLSLITRLRSEKRFQSFLPLHQSPGRGHFTLTHLYLMGKIVRIDRSIDPSSVFVEKNKTETPS